MNIPTSLIVVLLVVAWLVVLVPMIARRRERVPEAEPAGSNFRVLRRASASLRRRPPRGAKGSVVTGMDKPTDAAPDEPTEVPVAVGAVAHAEPIDAADEWAAAQAANTRRTSPLHEPLQAPPAGDSSEIHTDAATEISTDHDPAQLSLESPGEPAQEYAQPVRIGPDAAPTDDSAAPARVMVPDEVDEAEWTAHAAAAPTGTFADVDDEPLRPVPHRPGRGGFDPEAAEATRAYRYQQRRRVTLILLVATIAFTVAALVLVTWLWIGAGVSLALLVGYLTYLRRQVRIEAAIRQKRMERLQRSRQIRPEYSRPPRRVRNGMSAVAPGRTMVDLDDDDPGFDDLEEFQEPMTYRRAAGQ